MTNTSAYIIKGGATGQRVAYRLPVLPLGSQHQVTTKYHSLTASALVNSLKKYEEAMDKERAKFGDSEVSFLYGTQAPEL